VKEGRLSLLEIVDKAEKLQVVPPHCQRHLRTAAWQTLLGSGHSVGENFQQNRGEHFWINHVVLAVQGSQLGIRDRLGGAVGVALGAASTAVYAYTKGWATVIPTEAWASGFAASVIIGAVAGLMPALRAARLSPTQALWAV
jgi:hypothetical protein